MSIKINKNNKEYPLGFMPEHYPADRVYLDGDTSKTVQDAIDNKCKVLNGTITNDYSGSGTITKVNYPTGFDKNNSMVISSYMSSDSGNSWYPINTIDGNYVYLEAGGIFIYNTNGQFTGRIYRIALSRF